MTGCIMPGERCLVKQAGPVARARAGVSENRTSLTLQRLKMML